MSAVAPSKLSERHRYIAWLELGGATGNEIAAALGLTASWVSTVRNSPLYKMMLEDLRERVSDASIEEVKAKLIGEAMKNVNVLIDVRDGADAAQSRLAANDLLDRTPGMSKIHKTETDETLRVVFDGQDLRAIMQAIDEDEGRPPRAHPEIIPGVAVALPARDERIEIKPIEQFIAEYDDERWSR